MHSPGMLHISLSVKPSVKVSNELESRDVTAATTITRGLPHPLLTPRYSDPLRAGRSGDRIPVGVEIFRTRPDRPWGLPILLYNEYRVFPGGKAAGAKC